VIDSIFSWLLDPAMRTFYGYWIPTLLIALMWAGLNWQTRKTLISHWLNKEYWWNASTRQDYSLMFFNRGLFFLMGMTWIAFTIDTAQSVYWLLNLVSTPHSGDYQSIWWLTGVYTLCLFVLDDASRFLLHLAMHKFSWLWRIHQVHHTATSLTPFSTYRLHPLESLLYQLRASLVHGVCAGCAYFWLGAQLSGWELWGASIWVIVFNSLGANLRHSNIPIKYGPLEKWLISPAQHQLHHGIKTMGANYGSFLAVWDRLFNSWQAGQGTVAYPSKHQPLVKQLSMRPLKWH